ncbi:MAG: PAS domain S-box protein [Caldilineaceae bacterium]
MNKQAIEQTREQRRTEITRQFNAALADLVDVDRHVAMRGRLLEMLAQATGYTYALQSEMEPDNLYMQVTAAYAPSRLLQAVEKLTGFSLVGYRFVNDPAKALQTPPTEVFRHISDWRTDISGAAALAIEKLLGIQQIIAIRLHTGEHYLGAVNFFSTSSATDLPLLEYLCNNHLVYALRLMQEQSARARLQSLRTEELERRVQERTAELAALLAQSREAERQRMLVEEKLNELNLNLILAREDAETRLRETECLLDGLHVLNQARDFNQILAGMLDVLRNVLNFEQAFILQLDVGGNLVVLHSTDATLTDEIKQPQAFLRRVMANQVTVASDVTQSPAWQAQPTALLERVGATLFVPLQTAARYLLVCVHHERDFFTEKHVNLATHFSALATQALQNVELNTSLKVERDTLEARVRERTKEIESLARFPEEDPSPVLRVRTDGIIEYANRAGRELLAALAVSLGGSCPSAWASVLAEANRSNLPVELELDAGSRLLIGEFVPVAGAGYVNIYARDITERKQAQDQLEASEILKGAILESAADCIIAIDHEGYVIEWNPAAEKTLGWSREEVIGRLMQELIIPPVLRPFHEKGFQHYMATGDGPMLGQRMELSALRADGSTIPIELAIIPITLGDKPIFTAYLRDITERKQAESELERTHELYRRAIAAADAVPYLRNHVTDSFVFMGEAIHTITGYRAEEMTPALFDEIAVERIMRGEAEGVSVAEAVRRTQLGEFHRWLCDTRIRTRAGVERWVADASVEIYDDSGAPSGSIGILMDITERKRAEEETLRLATALKSTEEAIFITGIDGAIQYVNPAFARLSGFTREEAIGQNPRILKSGLHDATHYDEMWHRLLAGEVWSGAVLNKRKDGTLYFVEETIAPVRDETGRTTAYVAAQRDVTLRKQTEDKLRARTSRLTTLIENLQGGILVENELRQVAHINQAMCDMFNLPKPMAALVGSDCSHAAEDAKALFADPTGFVTRIDEILRERKTITAEELTLVDGRIFERDYVPIFVDQDYRGHLWHYRDITERKRAEQTLRESEEAIRSLYAITSDQQMNFSEKLQALLAMGCQRFNLEVGILSHVEDEIYTMVEVYEPEGNMVKGSTLPLPYTYCSAALQANNPICFEHAALSPWADHPGYARFGIEAYLGAPLRVANRLYGTLAFLKRGPRPTPFKASDQEFLRLMTQWVAGEIERQQRTEQLQAYAAKIEQANLDLAEARDQALEASRLKSEFLATMSHEIRTPMNGVIGMAELLSQTELDEEQQEYAGIVLKEADHLLSIINDILDFSKIEAGKLFLDKQDFAPLNLIESVAELFSAQATAKQLALMTFVAPDVPDMVSGDAGRLRQVLLNLVGNALKFTSKGEVVVRLTLEEATPTYMKLRCSVTDSGIGLSKAAQARLFQPFTQGDGGTTRRFGGTGLGLAIASRLVGLMDGAIGVESDEGKGSTFWFTVKLETASSEASMAKMNPVNLKGLRVLIVDDNATHRDILQTYLRVWGMQTECATRGTEGLMCLVRAATTGQPYDLAIIDQMMPGMDGTTLGQTVRSEPALAMTHLIMLTAFDEKGQAQRAQEIGYAAYLTKPVRQARLLETITRIMTGAASAAKMHQAAEPIQEVVQPPVPLLPAPNPNQEQAPLPLILLVEDQTGNQIVAHQQLLRLGYKADIAQNGQEALARLAQPDHAYQLVLMDCQMPGMDGFEATQRLREHEQALGGHIPVIAMTAQALKGDRERCIAVGMDDYISKPVRMEDLSRVITRWLKNEQVLEMP